MKLKDSGIGFKEMVYCINHPKVEAISWSGHIHHKGKKVFVGRCEKCQQVVDSCDQASGCKGEKP